MNKGWIKLHRSLSDWEWYDDKNCVLLLIHLLVSVNYEDKKWKGILIKAGSMVLSWDTLARESKLSVRKCRTAMSKLISSGEVTRQVTNKYQLVSLVKWEELQNDDRQMTNKRQTNDKQTTTTKETNNIITNNTISSPTEKTNIDFKKLLDFINLKTQRQFKVINDSLKAKYKARLKDGYTSEDIRNAIVNACKDEYHKENNFKYLKPEYFSRANTLDLHAFKKQKPIQNYSNENPYKKDLEIIENNRKEYLKTKNN
jgi:uncharacterized phage protein (TIGR02220 family)